MTDRQGGVRWPLLLVGGVCLVGVGVTVGYRLRPDALRRPWLRRRNLSRLTDTARTVWGARRLRLPFQMRSSR